MDTNAHVDDLIQHFNCLQLPIGVYFVAPDGRFLQCNQEVCQILDLPREGVTEVNISDFYVDPERRAELLEKSIEAEMRGRHLEKEIIHFCVAGRETHVENYCKPLRDPTTQAIVGYVGCLVDVTAEYELEKRKNELQRKLEELTLDIGRVLHANTTTLVMAQQTLEAVVEFFSPHPFKDQLVPASEKADEMLIAAAAYLADTIERLLVFSAPERQMQALPEARWKLLSERVTMLRDIEKVVIIPEMRLPTLRKIGHEIADVCREVQPKWLARELVRNTLQEAMRLEQLTCLIDVLNTRNVIIQMDFSLRSLRDFITADVRIPETSVRLSVNYLVEQSIVQLAEFARTSNVEIVWRNRGLDIEVIGSERDLVRALSSLLHNAIKYTWRRNRMGMPWVIIRTQARDGIASIELQNWGVPIAEDELKQGLIFQLGYRGKWSTDRGRLGTGIGLADVQRVAQSHGGALQVSSTPASPAGHRKDDPAYYEQAFLTTVTFSLPELSVR